MILRLILENFLSFNDLVQFDMFPNVKRTSLSNHIYAHYGSVPVLKMAAVYGSNGAGKSNMLKGINFLKALATDKTFLDKDNIVPYFFALKDDASSQSIALAVEFITSEGTPFLYNVEIGKNGIQEENLSISGLGSKDNQIVFSRKGTAVEYAVSPSAEVKNMILGWMDKHPFASLLTINNDMPVLADENIVKAHKWFAEELVVIGLHSFNPALITQFKDNAELNAFASELFKSVDLGINNVKVSTEDFDEWAKTHDANILPTEKVKSMRSGVLSAVIDYRNTLALTVENGTKKVSQMMFKQFGANGYSRDMDIMAQSDGTVRLLSLVPAFYGAAKEGRTVVIDEIDHSIHPHLVRELVRYFSSQDTNGQIIFTTHQTCLLNQEFIRTDEVWMVEKKDGGSRMYSLNDYKIHNTINIENGYMEGRYGAIPFIGELNM